MSQQQPMDLARMKYLIDGCPKKSPAGITVWVIPFGISVSLQTLPLMKLTKLQLRAVRAVTMNVVFSPIGTNHNLVLGILWT